MTRIVIVNENDEVIGSKEREEVTADDVYRVSALWLKNSNGDCLMAQRAFTKKKNPGKWGPAVAGTLEEGETYESNIVKEIQEEIGISVPIDMLTKGPHMRRKSAQSNYFVQWFVLTQDIPITAFVIERKEVEAVAWFSREGLLADVARNPEKFLAGQTEWLPKLINL